MTGEREKKFSGLELKTPNYILLYFEGPSGSRGSRES